MSGREKILVLASVIAFIWGGILFMDNLGKNKSQTLSDDDNVTGFIGKVTDSIGEDPEGGMDRYLLARARGPWGNSPFQDAGERLYGPDDNWRYQGYVRSGTRIFALINNREYGLGEDLDGKGLRVKSIGPDRVVCVEKGKKKRILPLEGGL